MENYIDTIDLINAYINNTLSKAERLRFENRLKIDLEFNELYKEQLAILEGIKRVELTNEIQTARQSYVRTKWMKYIGISVGVVLISLITYHFIFKTETPKVVVPTTDNNIEIIADSITTDTPLEINNEKPIVSEEIKTNTKEIATSPKVTRKDSSIEEVAEKKEVVPSRNSEEKTETIVEEIKPEPTSPELKAFFKSVKKAPQIIEVNTEKEFTVTCKEGTKLTIPAKAFVDVKTGKLARGKINLEVTEYYKLSDMLLDNLSTKSDDKILETGGMLHLDANKKGKKLKLKSGKRIIMAFNNKGKENMQLFTGEERSEGVNWKLQNTGKLISEYFEEDVEVSMAVIEEPPLYPGCDEEKNREEIVKCLSDNIAEYVKNNYDVTIADDDSKLSGKIKLYAYFNINQNGDIDNIVARAPNKKLGDEIIRVLESLPKLEPGFQRGTPVRVTYHLPFYITKEGKTKSYDVLEVRSLPRDSSITHRIDNPINIKTTSQRRLVNYAFASANLGWINCDRFVRSKKKKVKVKIKIKDHQGANVKMVFKSMSAILPSKKFDDGFDFRFVPSGEEITLIAIKKIDDKLYLSKKESTTDAISEQDLDFREVTIQELKSELQKLNSSFN